jgi:hypothetical protein
VRMRIVVFLVCAKMARNKKTLKKNLVQSKYSGKLDAHTQQYEENLQKEKPSQTKKAYISSRYPPSLAYPFDTHYYSVSKCGMFTYLRYACLLFCSCRNSLLFQFLLFVILQKKL